MNINMLGDQNRSFGFADTQVAGQPMNNQIIPRAMMSPTGHQSLKAGFVPQQMPNQFYHSQHPRTPLPCYGKMPDVPINSAGPVGRYMESSPQPKNYFYGNQVAPYNSPGQVRYNDGNYYQHQPYPQVQQQQHYYKQHQQMSPMLPQNAGYYQDVPQQNVGYPQRMMQDQMGSPGWNNLYKMQPQMMEGSTNFGDCPLPKGMMPKHGMERFHSPGRCSSQQVLPGAMEFKKERYTSPPHRGYDPRMYSYGFDGQMEKYKANNMKYPEEMLYQPQAPSLCATPQLGNYLPGKRLEHFSQSSQHVQMGGYDMGGSYSVNNKVSHLDMDKMRFQNPLPYCNDQGYYKTNPMEQVHHFKSPQRRFACPNTLTQSGEGVIKKVPAMDQEMYHSPSTETCSGSSSPSYFEVDIKYSTSSSGYPMFSSPSSLPQMNLLDTSSIKTEPLSSINFLVSQNQPSASCQSYQRSLERQSSSSGVNPGPPKTHGPVPCRSGVSSLMPSLLSQSSKCITSTVKMTPTPSRISTILDSMVVKKVFPLPGKRQGGHEERYPKVVVPRKNKRRKVFGEAKGATTGKSSGVRYITVPYKWRRIIENESVYYISPSRVRLESLKEICQYLLTDGTCKCGLLCPLHVDQVFVFDWNVRSRYMTAEEVYNSSNNVASLCYHKRKYKQSVSAAIMAASAGGCRPVQQDRRGPEGSAPRILKPVQGRMKGALPMQGRFNSPVPQGFGYSEVGDNFRKRTYTKVREKRKSKLETALCDSLKNPLQSSPTTLTSSFSKQMTLPSSAFTVFQGQLKDSLQAKTSNLDSYDSDATKSASDIYCSLSSSDEDDEEDGFMSKPPNVAFKSSLVRLPRSVDGGKVSTRSNAMSSLLPVSASSLMPISFSVPLTLAPASSMDPCLEQSFVNPTKTPFQRKSYQAHGANREVDPSPIKLVENMVSGLLMTRNSLAEVTTLMMSKVDFDRRRRLASDGRSVPGSFGEPVSSGYRMDEAIHESVANHLKHLNAFKSNTSSNSSINASIIKPASMSLPHSNTFLPCSSPVVPPSLAGIQALMATSGSQSIFSSPMAAGRSVSLNSIVLGHLVSTPGFFYKSPMEVTSGLVPKLCSTDGITSTRVVNPSVSTMSAAASLNAGSEEMFSEDEEDNSSCVVIENWLEEGGSGTDASTNHGATGETPRGPHAGEPHNRLTVSVEEEDLMKTTGTQTSTPASNVSNFTLELVDHDGDSRETICCTGVENATSLEEVMFSSVVTASTTLSLPSTAISKTSTAVSPVAPADNEVLSNSSGSCSIVSTVTNNSSAESASSMLPQQVPQAQVVMVPAQQPFLIPHHQTFDAQLYQTSPAGYLQSLGFGFAQGQVGLLHFGQVVAPTSSASSQGLGLALGLGVNLSGGVMSGGSRELSSQQSSDSVQQSSNALSANLALSSAAVQAPPMDSIVPSSTIQSAPASSSSAGQDQTSGSSVAANQLFQLVVSQGVQPAHHFLVPNYSSFAPFAGAALVPVPMVQQNSMAFCNLVAASGAPTLFTVGQSPFGFVAAAGPATMQMLTGVNVGEKREDSSSVSAIGHDAPDSTVDSEETGALPCTSTCGGTGGDMPESGSALSMASDGSGTQVISSSRCSTESMTCQAAVASVPPSMMTSKPDEPNKASNELSSSSETDDETGFELSNKGVSKSPPGELEKSMTINNGEEEEDADDRCMKDRCDGSNCEGRDKSEGDFVIRRRVVRRRFDGASIKGAHFLGVTKLIKQNKSKKLKALFSKSRLVGKTVNQQHRASVKRAPKLVDIGSFSPALSGTSENTSSEVIAGETATPCSSSGDCRVTTTDSTAMESAYRADDTRLRSLSTMKGILRKKVRKVKGQTKLLSRQQKPDSPVSSDNTIDDVDSTTTTTTPVSLQGLRSFNIGDLVWGPARGFPSWPGKLVSENEVRGNPKPENGKIWVKWFGDNTYAQADLDQLKTLSEGLETHHNARKSHRRGRKMNAGLEAAIQEAMSELDRQMADQHHKSAAAANNGNSNGSSSNTSSSASLTGERPNKKSRRC